MWDLFKASGTSPFPRSYHTSTPVDLKIYIYGGYSTESKKASSALFVLNLAGLGGWNSPGVTGALPRTRCGHSAVLSGKNMFVFGGIDGDPESNDASLLLNDLHCLAVDRCAWSKPRFTGEPPPPMMGHSCVMTGVEALFFGGKTAAGPTSALYTFHTARRQWNEIKVAEGSPCPCPRYGHGACLAGKTVFIFGGCDGSKCLNDLWGFDTATKLWKEYTPKAGTALPPAVMFPGMCALDSFKLFVSGGKCGNGASNNLNMVFDISASAWLKADVPKYGVTVDATSRYAHTVCEVSKKLYNIGGIAASPITAANVALISKLTYTPLPGELSTAKPAEAPKPAEAAKPVEAPKPVAAKPAETPKPVAKPAKSPKPVEAPKPAAAKLVEAPKPAAKPVETPKPAAKPVETPKPAVKPVEAPKPAAKPAEAPKAAEAAKQEILSEKLHQMSEKCSKQEAEVARLKKELEESKARNLALLKSKDEEVRRAKEEKAAAASNAEAQESAEIARLKKELDESKARNLALVKSKEEESKRAAAAAKGEKDAVAADLAAARADVAKLTEELDALRADLEDEKHRGETAQQDAAKLAEELAAARARAEQAEQTAAKASPELETLRRDAEAKAADAAKCAAELESVRNEVKSAKEQLEAANAEKTELVAKAAAREQEAKKLEESLREAEARAAALSQGKEDTQKLLADLEKARTALAESERKAADADAKAAGLQTKVDALTAAAEQKEKSHQAALEAATAEERTRAKAAEDAAVAEAKKELEAKVAELEGKVAALDDDSKEKDVIIENTRAELEQWETKFANGELVDSADVDAIKAELEKANVDLEKAKADLEASKTAAEASKADEAVAAEKKALEGKVTELEGKVAALDDDSKEKDVIIENTRAELEQWETKFANGEIVDRSELDSLKTELEEAKAAAAAAGSAGAGAAAAPAGGEVSGEAQAQIEELQQSLAAMEDDRNQWRDLCEQIEKLGTQSLSEHEEKLAEAQEQINALTARNEQLEHDLAVSDQKMNQLDTILSKLTGKKH